MARGGKRENSGRKEVAPDIKRVQMVITLAPETKDKLKAISQATGVKPGRIIDQLISNYEE